MAIFHDSVEIGSEITSVARFRQYLLRSSFFCTWKEVFRANTVTSVPVVMTVVAPVNRAPLIMLKSKPQSPLSLVTSISIERLAFLHLEIGFP